MTEFKPYRSGIARKQALPMSELVDMYIRSMKLAAGLNTRCIFSAWDEVSQASAYTIRRFFRDGVLYITLNSSMARTHLEMQKDQIRDEINKRLLEDSLFVQDDPRVGFVKKIILK